MKLTNLIFTIILAKICHIPAPKEYDEDIGVKCFINPEDEKVFNIFIEYLRKEGFRFIKKSLKKDTFGGFEFSFDFHRIFQLVCYFDSNINYLNFSVEWSDDIQEVIPWVSNSGDCCEVYYKRKGIQYAFSAHCVSDYDYCSWDYRRLNSKDCRDLKRYLENIFC